MKPGRNDACPCGSGQKYKRCCGLERPVPVAAGAFPAASRGAVAPAARGSPGAQQIAGLVALLAQGLPDQAERRALESLAVHPEAGMLWKILGVAQLRQGKDAETALRRTTQLLPRDAEAHANLGAALHDRGAWAEARASLMRALEIDPHHVDALVDAADAERALGRPREAVLLYQRALARDPGRREARNNLGNAFLALGRCRDAADCYRAALELAPDDAEIHCNLGNAERRLGNLEAALTSTRRALALDPSLCIAHNNLGLTLAAAGDRAQAVQSFSRALSGNPGYVEAINNLGIARRDLGELREAAMLHARAVELEPGRADSHWHLGNVLLEVRRFDEAAACFERALALDPQHAPAQVSLATVMRLKGRPAEAEAGCRAALATDPASVDALSLLGELAADRGRFAAAEDLFQQALARDPQFPFAYCSVAAHRRMTRADAAWLAGARALAAKPLPLRDAIGLRHALGKYFDDVGDYDAAFEQHRLANELAMRQGAGYDPQRQTRRVDAIIAAFDEPFLRRRRELGSDSELPVFIIGMPRSGTSLAEQILASHPSVFGAGELTFWGSAFGAYEAAGAAAADNRIPDMARDYLERLTALCAGATRVIDKMPGNFLCAGLIHAALPNARFIHMQRHPIDTCLSIYFQHFSTIHPYANDFGRLAHYYREYQRLTAHWRAVLPAASLLEIPYEALIEDQEGWTRRMLEFAGLPWDPRCLEFERTDRVVITASKWQVRQKIHAASAGRWRHYEAHLGPLRALVEPAPPPAR